MKPSIPKMNQKQLTYWHEIVTRKMVFCPIYCTEATKELGYYIHKCSNSYVLPQKKNQDRYNLHQFDVNNPENEPIIKKLLLVHPTINCAAYEFELCNNFRHRFNAQTSQRRVVKQQEETSRTTLPVDAQEGVTATTLVKVEF